MERPNGDIQEDFYVQRGSFQARLKHFKLHEWVLPDTNHGHWRVQVLWPIKIFRFWLFMSILNTSARYLVNNRKLGWIYARMPIVSEADYQDLLGLFRWLGYDTSNFVRFVQFPAQIGKLGLWSEGIH